MKDPIYIIIIIFIATFFTGLTISCYNHEKQLKIRLAETEKYLNANEDELYKTLLQVQNHIEENNNLKNEIDDLKSKNNKLIKRNEGLAIEINDLKNEIDELSNKNKTKTTSEKVQVRPSLSVKEIKDPKRNIIENKDVIITNKDIKSFLDGCKKPLKEIQNYLFRLRDVDLKPIKSRRKLGDFWYNMQISSRVSNRKVFCRIIINESTELHYKISRKIKNLPEDNSTIQYRKTLNSIDQYLKTIIDCCKIHTQITTKGEMDTYTTSALQAVERINNIIDSF